MGALPRECLGRPAKLGPLDRQGVRACLDLLPISTNDTLYGLFVDDRLNLLAVDMMALGLINVVRPGIGRLLNLGRECDAKAIILAYPAPSDDLLIDFATHQYVAHLRSYLSEFELPLLDYLMVGPTRIFGIGSW